MAECGLICGCTVSRIIQKVISSAGAIQLLLTASSAHSTLVLQKVPSEDDPKVRNHREGAY